MKFILKENQGYALITVLLIITIFGILSLAFMTKSISSMKQNTSVEKKSQSVEFAEMGATYFQYAVTNASKNLLPNVINTVEEERNQDINNKEFKSEDKYTERAITLLVNSLRNQLDSTIEEREHLPLSIDPIFIEKNYSDQKIIINSQSIGNKDGTKSPKSKLALQSTSTIS